MDEATKQISLMSAMFTQASGFSSDSEGSSGTKFVPPMNQGFTGSSSSYMPFMPMSSMPPLGFQ